MSGNSIVAIGEHRSELRLAERFYLALTAISAIYSISTGMYAGQECLRRELPWCVILSADALWSQRGADAVKRLPNVR
ncbi:Hypothetical protein HEAR2088 [Herminiimonas arsenicoxydans]|uniref:Uncharacterized protein n=1 Tax=Herminiimonas arsenicoxydans TaxID=204773 RepID=A4G6U2_HERAR|nr:Hypothetical protein HEAR2088 [Herminiimonas arsenicoxydans]